MTAGSYEKELKDLLLMSAERTHHVLNLSHRELKVIPAEISTLTHVQVLLLNNNNIIMPPEEITHLKNLKHLSLEFNQLTLLPSNLHTLASTLTFLNLSHNPLTFLPPYFSQLINLKDLWLSHVGLTYLPKELSHLAHLQVLSLEGNALSEVDETLNCLTDFHWLSLAKNKLTDVELLRLKNLRVIILAENQLTSIPSSLVAHPSPVEYINLCRNKIPSLPNDIISLKHLAKIDLRNNPIESSLIPNSHDSSIII